MKVETRLFGDIEIMDNRIIHFVGGLVGFPELKDFALIHEDDDPRKLGIQWLQSMQDGTFAIPVINPLLILECYNPIVEDDLLTLLGELNPENMLVLVTISVPEDITKMSINLKGPIVINAQTGNACQVIAEKEELKFLIYDILKARRVGE